MTRTLLLALLALLLLPAAAGAHSTVQVFGDEIIYASEDAVSDNNLIVDETATEIRFYDEEADNGVQSTDSRCRTGKTAGSGGNVFVIEVHCRKQGLSKVSIDVGPNQDRVKVTLGAQWTTVGVAGNTGADQITVSGPSNDFLSGDQGNDIIDGGDGNDEIRGAEGDDQLIGGNGDDKIQPASGADRVDAGAGDDIVTSPDGVKDTIVCAAGSDTVKGDTVDDVGPDCEAVERVFVAPPAGGGSTGNDTTKPKVRVGGAVVQRVSMRRRTIRLAVVSNERGEVAASGFLDADGLNLPLKSKSHKIKVAGGGTYITIKLSRTAMRYVLRDFKRGRRPTARLNVVATDDAGNAALAKRFKLRLRRR